MNRPLYLTAAPAITRAAIGSAHDQPNRLFTAIPISTTAALMVRLLGLRSGSVGRGLGVGGASVTSSGRRWSRAVGAR
jgi:small neutral amino acid transporter SnatA (MarC family)